MADKPKPKSRKAGARESAVEERRRQAAEMRKNAMSLRQIASALGVSHETARLDIEHGLKRLREETLIELEAYRSIQVARREEIINAHRPAALDPDDPKSHASAGVIHAQETAIAKLMGTDMPIQTENKTEISQDGAPTFTFEFVDAQPMTDDNDEEDEDGTDDKPA